MNASDEPTAVRFTPHIFACESLTSRFTARHGVRWSRVPTTPAGPSQAWPGEPSDLSKQQQSCWYSNIPSAISIPPRIRLPSRHVTALNRHRRCVTAATLEF